MNGVCQSLWQGHSRLRGCCVTQSGCFLSQTLLGLHRNVSDEDVTASFRYKKRVQAEASPSIWRQTDQPYLCDASFRRKKQRRSHRQNCASKVGLFIIGYNDPTGYIAESNILCRLTPKHRFWYSYWGIGTWAWLGTRSVRVVPRWSI